MSESRVSPRRFIIAGYADDGLQLKPMVPKPPKPVEVRPNIYPSRNISGYGRPSVYSFFLNTDLKKQKLKAGHNCVLVKAL